ncbi:MAG: DUF1611 domain-containing protein [Clostridia bacterium]|nr:DUF1611 domain-containing protein [Clostridia bacterium]
MIDYNVIIIDSGYSGNNRNVNGTCIINGIIADDYSDSCGHGTTIVNQMIDYCNDINVYVIKICETEDSFLSSDLLLCFKYILSKNFHNCIVNVSLGVIQFREKNSLYSIINQLLEKGIIVVAANNPLCLSYPASLPNVIGVDVSNSPEIMSSNGFYFNINSYVDVVFPNKSIRAKNKNGIVSFYRGSSLYTALISSMLIEAIICGSIDDFTFEKIVEYLKNKADKTFFFKKTKNNKRLSYNKPQKAVAFPFNKEIQVLSANEELLSFEEIDYYDFDYSQNNNKKICDILGYSNNNKIIKPIRELDFDKSFDTFICGHCGRLSSIIKNDVLQMVIDRCNEYSKDIYLFDNYQAYNINTKIKIFTPYISHEYVSMGNGNKLFDIAVPIVAVMGTSSLQGKYSLQLALRMKMKQMGYSVKNLSTEPSGYLFELESVVPMGFESNYNLNSLETVVFLNEEINRITDDNTDIVIVGSQSGTVPLMVSNIGYYNMTQHDFLLGTHPDCVLLCVNTIDDFDLIRRTINYIESCVETKVIALIISPLVLTRNDFEIGIDKKKISEQTLFETKEKFTSAIGLPVFSHEEIDSITNGIIEFLS